MKIPSIVICTTLICLTTGLPIATPTWANPTGTEPNRALAAHGTIDGAKELVASLYKLYDETEKFVIQTYERRDTPATFSDRQISKSYGQLWLARRQASHLTLMGEPAGGDLYNKMHMLLVQVGRFGTAYRGTPKGQQLVARINQQLTRQMPALNKFLQQADAAIQQGKLEIVEQQLEAKGVELHSQIAFLTATDANKYFQNLAGVLGKNDGLLNPKRKQAYVQQATEVMQQQVTAAVEFPAEANRIRGEIAASGTAKLGKDQTGGAPEAFAHLALLWGNASAGLLRATAIQWAFTNRAETQVEPSPARLKEVALLSLASIVEAAAASTPPDQVPSTYTQLLKQISQVDRRSGLFSRDVSKACQDALAKLAAKDPGFKARIDAYDRATSEVLRWRLGYAAQQATHLAQRFPAAAVLLASKGEVSSHIRPEFAGKPTGETLIAPSSFGSPANWMVHEAAQRLIGKPVSDDLMIRLTPTSRTAVVPYRASHYGNVAVPLPSDDEVKDLRNALVVDDTYGPLTIEAADAVSAAELQDYTAVAGLIQTIQLEAVVTRFVGLPDVAYTLAPLGTTPVLDQNIPPLQQTCWRLDVEPMWAKQRYFTTRVQSSSQ